MPMEMGQEVESTRRFFASNNITLDDEWLQSCIQWCREENPNVGRSLDTLHMKVYEQWLLLDLRQVELPVLPPNLSLQVKMVINGVYPLQVMQVVDISRPKLSQIQKIRHPTAFLNNAAVDQEYSNVNDVSAKRMLQLLLSDGVQEIEAIEYTPIRSLNVNLTPGTKIRITGPVAVRRGQIMLEEKHVKLLGGEVEELLIENAAENVLARALNLPLNRKPIIVEEPVKIENQARNVQQNRNPSIQYNRNVQPNKNQNTTTSKPITQKTGANQTTLNQYLNLQSISCVSEQISHSSNFISTNKEEKRIEEEIDMLLETERELEMETRPVSKFENNTNSNNVFKMEDSTSPLSTTKIPNLKMDQHSSLLQSKNSSTDSVFEAMDIDAHLDEVDKQVATRSSRMALSIHQLLNRSIMSGKFTIKAKFKRIVQKLSVTEDAWRLKIAISDGTGNLEAFVHTDVVSNLIDCTPSTMMALKRDMAKALQKVDILKEKLENLNCFMQVLYTADKDSPFIVKLLDS